jgi:hypothetical protein
MKARRYILRLATRTNNSETHPGSRPGTKISVVLTEFFHEHYQSLPEVLSVRHSFNDGLTKGTIERLGKPHQRGDIDDISGLVILHRHLCRTSKREIGFSRL